MEQLKQEMLEHGLGGLFEALSPYAKNAVYMELEEEDCGLGESKMGGEPDLPVGLEWPRTSGGMAMTFITQINFAEVHPFDLDGKLPESGMLWFFYDCSDEGMPWGFDPKDADGWKVLYAEHADLEPAEVPEDLEVTFSEARVTFQAQTDLLNTDSDLCDGIELPDEEIDNYYDWQEEREGSGNKLLGHSDNIQGGMELECEYVTHGLYCGDGTGYKKAKALGLDKNAGHWNLLMQVESNEDLGMMWGDLGRLYLWITDEDLKARRFDKAWLILQCG